MSASRNIASWLNRRNYSRLVETLQTMAGKKSSTISVTFLSNGSTLSPRKSVIISTAFDCYLINAPEGLSRVVQQSGPRMSKISHIFVTGNQYELIGGLIGISLDVGATDKQSCIHFHGPPIVTEVVKLMSKFSDTGVELVHNSEPNFADGVFQIRSLSVSSNLDQAQSYCYLFKPNPLPPNLDIQKAIRMDFPISMLKDGVTANRIKEGQTICTPDGRVFDGKEMLIKPAASKSIVILDCANLALASQLAASEQLRQWVASNNEGDSIDLAIHLADSKVLQSEEYRAVVDVFKGSGAKHVVMQGDNPILAMYSSYQNQLMLNSLHDRIFPLLYGHRFMSKESEAAKPEPSDVAVPESGESVLRFPLSEMAALVPFPDSAVSCEMFQEYHIRPPIGFDSARQAGVSVETEYRFKPTSEAAIRDKVFQDDEAHITRVEFAKRMAEFAEQQAKYQLTDSGGGGGGGTPAARSFPWVQFLGTVSSSPNKFRNVSAILVHLRKDVKVLLDCGEGTLLQLLNFYGEKKCQAVLRSIRLVCISHMHLDHKGGIYSLLKARLAAFAAVGVRRPPACGLVAPRGFGRWVDFFSTQGAACGLKEAIAPGNLEIFWSEILCELPSPTLFVDGEPIRFRFREFVKATPGLDSLEPVPVDHRTKVAFGIIMTGRHQSSGGDQPWKIVYSGDTVPCQSLVDAGMNCDLLIHEATFEDGLEREAARKKHSTVGQALSQATRMQARHTILTHFSSRYTCAVPLLAVARQSTDELSTRFANVGFAYDHMCVSLRELHLLSRITPMLQCIFPKHFSELERRSERWWPLLQSAGAAGAGTNSDEGSNIFGVRRTPQQAKRRKFDE